MTTLVPILEAELVGRGYRSELANDLAPLIGEVMAVWGGDVTPGSALDAFLDALKRAEGVK